MARSISPDSSTLRLAVSGAGTPFLDGYSTASAAFVITFLTDMPGWQIGLFTSLYFVGFSTGSIAFGALADRFGRRGLFVYSMLGMTAASLLPAVQSEFLPTFAALLASRLITGFLLGGDYPVGQALVTELTPRESQSRSLTFLMYGWYVGAIFAVLLYVPFSYFGLPWQAFFWIEAAVALLLFAGRIGVPESPSWRGEKKERSIELRQRKQNEPGLMQSLAGSTGQNFLFCSVFWLCQTIPATVLMLYSTKILTDLIGSGNAFVQVLLLYACFFAGVLPAAWGPFVRHPKRVLVGTFIAMGAALLLITALKGAGTPLITGGAFILFALAYGLQTPLDFVVPNLLFPERVRARLVGSLTTISRVGTMASAFLFPMLAEHVPVTALFAAGAFILFFGAFYSYRYAPADHELR